MISKCDGIVTKEKKGFDGLKIAVYTLKKAIEKYLLKIFSIENIFNLYYMQHHRHLLFHNLILLNMFPNL